MASIQQSVNQSKIFIYEDNKYFTTKENLKKTIEMYGVAIIPNVITEEECVNMLNGMWEYFEHITKNWTKPILHNNLESWKEIYKLYPLHSMLIQYWNVGHAQVSWNIRQNPKIIEIFAHFWKCSPEELLVSFDGLSFNLPPETTKSGWSKTSKDNSNISTNTWLHTDQSFMNNEFKCIQSWVTALDVNEGDATLAFMEGSNKYHKDFNICYKISEKANNKKSIDYIEHRKKYKNDWYKLNNEEEQFYLNKGCSYKKIKCPKGSMVFWDSRTIHCGTEAMKTREKPNIRAIIYLCYMPRSLCSKVDLEKKKKAFNELRSTNHWASNPKLFAKNPRTYGGDIPDITTISNPILNELGKKLAGF